MRETENKIKVVDFIKDIDLYLFTNEFDYEGCETCGYDSLYGTDYEIVITDTGEKYKFSTTHMYEQSFFTKESLKYNEDTLLKDFVENLEIVSEPEFDEQGCYTTSKLFLPVYQPKTKDDKNGN